MSARVGCGRRRRRRVLALRDAGIFGFVWVVLCMGTESVNHKLVVVFQGCC